MPWPVILVALAEALVFAALVWMLGWAVAPALLMVIALTGLISMALLALSMLIAGKERSGDVLFVFQMTIKKGAKAMWRHLRIRR